MRNQTLKFNYCYRSLKSGFFLLILIDSLAQKSIAKKDIWVKKHQGRVGFRGFKNYIFLPASKGTNAQNFYLLKIRLNLFEISNIVLKFENLI
jgi:hypothetical protein